MPLFFFDMFGSEQKLDHTGTYFPNEAAARQEAVLRSLNDTSHRLAHYRAFNRILVRDETGRIICEVPIQRRRRHRAER